jgi:hypothetical protein
MVSESKQVHRIAFQSKVDVMRDSSRAHVASDSLGDLSVNLGIGAAFWDWRKGEARSTIRCSPEQTEQDGSVPFGLLAVIADNNNAMANHKSAKWSDGSVLIEVAYQATRSARGTIEVRSLGSAFDGSSDPDGV